MMHVIGALAVALREAAQSGFQGYARQVVSNGRALADALATAGLRPVSGGTDTHVALVDLRETGVSGAVAETRCDLARITLTRNAIPYDPEKPAVTSGIRVGTAAVTTQGMGENEMRQIAALIAAAVRADPESGRGAACLADVADEASALVRRFPAYPPQEVLV
jgi:glycine hydroxymethyltransferase